MRTRIRTAAVVAAAVALVAGFVITTSSEASAAETCPAKKYCIYENANFTKLLVSSDAAQVPWIGASKNDKASSIINNTDTPLDLYQDVNFSGWYLGMIDGHSKAVLTPAQDNKLSSYFLY